MIRAKFFGLVLTSISLSTLSISAVFAQDSGETPAALTPEVRVNILIDSAMKTVDDRALDFNQHVAAINEARPLELKNLDSSTLSQNISRILEFTEYLSQYRATDDSLAAQLQDSIAVLRAEFTRPAGPSLQDFQNSYETDRRAFDAYVEALRGVYSDVLDALTFLQHSSYAIKHGELQFSVAKDIETYRKLMKRIDAATKVQQSAISASRKATKAANDQLKEINKSARKR